MPPGKLRHHIDIGRYVDTVDKWGDPGTPTWTSVCKTWASAEGLRGSQYYASQQTVDQSDHKVTIRYIADIVPGLVVKHDGREFTITAALDEDGTRRWLTLHCHEEKPS